MARPETAVVVISHYNAWPTDQLVKLLDQIQAIPAGYPFALRIVVNQARDGRLRAARAARGDPEIHVPRERRLQHRRLGPRLAARPRGLTDYLFLQEECAIQRPGGLAQGASSGRRNGPGWGSWARRSLITTRRGMT